MQQSTRLIFNTLVMFARMAITVGIGLVATRLMIQYLGDDYGLLITLGATGALLQVITNALSSSIQRHLSFEIGRPNQGQVRKIFNTALVLFVLLGVLLWVLGQGLAPWILGTLKIPDDRQDAAWWVYQISLVSMVMGVLTTPFRSAILAFQKHLIIASLEVVGRIAGLVIILSLVLLPWDILVTYVSLTLLLTFLINMLLAGFCLYRIPISRPSLQAFDRQQLRPLLGYTAWTAVGGLSWRLRMQGGIFLLGIFFGGAITVAYGIAMQVAGYITTFTQAIRMAVQPVIVGAEAKGDRIMVHRLALVSGKYAVLLLSLLFIPIWIEAQAVLDLWLVSVPEYAAVFVRLVIIWTMLGVHKMGYGQALHGTGQISWFMRTILLLTVIVLVVVALSFHLGAEPWMLPGVTLVGVVLENTIAIAGIGKQIELPVRRWLRRSLLPTLAVLVPASLIATFIHRFVGEDTADIIRIVAVSISYSMVALPLIWFVGLERWEREKFGGIVSTGLSKLFAK